MCDVKRLAFTEGGEGNGLFLNPNSTEAGMPRSHYIRLVNKPCSHGSQVSPFTLTTVICFKK